MKKVVFVVLVALLPFISVLPTEAKSKTQASDVQTQTVYITRTGAKYHREGCRYLRRSMIPIDLSDARRSYGACSVCRPPR